VAVDDESLWGRCHAVAGQSGELLDNPQGVPGAEPGRVISPRTTEAASGARKTDEDVAPMMRLLIRKAVDSARRAVEGVVDRKIGSSQQIDKLEAQNEKAKNEAQKSRERHRAASIRLLASSPAL